MDADVAAVPAADDGRLTAAGLRAAIDALERADRDRVFAVVATSGTTNVGVVDDLTAAAGAAQELATWLHVDGAYGGAALAAPSWWPAKIQPKTRLARSRPNRAAVSRTVGGTVAIQSRP